jgi:alpha/beta superfamily hydrolase
MARRIEPVALEGPAGRLEAQLLVPERPRPGAALLCHPHPQHGGTMHTKALYHAARAIASQGIPVLRFNFRGVGRSAGRSSGGPGERQDARAALELLASRHVGEPLLVGGFSFGSWVGLAVGAEDPRVVSLLGIAPPVALYDFSFLEAARQKILCVAGDGDPFCPAPDLESLVARIGPRAQLVRLHGAEHLLTTHLRQLASVVTDFVAGAL